MALPYDETHIAPRKRIVTCVVLGRTAYPLVGSVTNISTNDAEYTVEPVVDACVILLDTVYI
jgi:hypothetical protein